MDTLMSHKRLGLAAKAVQPEKQQSNGSLYSNTVIGTLAVDGWAVTFGTPRSPVLSSLYQM